MTDSNIVRFPETSKILSVSDRQIETPIMLRSALLQAAAMVSDMAHDIDHEPSLLSDLCECIDKLNKDLLRLANGRQPVNSSQPNDLP